MTQRINFFEKGQKAIKAMYGFGVHLSKCTIEHSLLDLVAYRVSQLNGCAFCLDMHSKDLLDKGEDQQRIFVLDAWREAPFYTDRERAALAWAEAVTKLTANNVPDEVYNEAREEFSEEELIDLTIGIIATSSYNRINIAFRTTAGSYTPGQFAVKAN